MIPCAFCRCAFNTWPEIAKHLIMAHANEMVAGRFLLRTHPLRPMREEEVICWCGAVCCARWTFGEHLEANGGVAAHLLAIGLGIIQLEEDQL